MKRGGCDHPKIRRLGRKLGVPRLHAIGLIEVVIEFARRYASDGDLGRHDPEDLAQACDWDRDPQELIDGLIETGWLDLGPPLFVHDWHIHADDATLRGADPLHRDPLDDAGPAFLGHVGQGHSRVNR
mgnify:CR=1 FL=1